MSIVLIPAFEPDERLIALVRELAPHGPVVVVDDGSDASYAPVFAASTACGALVLAHARNRGKGAALRTGFAAIAARWPDADVVTADADGQHTPADIARVAAALSELAGAALAGAALAGASVPTPATDGVPAAASASIARDVEKVAQHAGSRTRMPRVAPPSPHELLAHARAHAPALASTPHDPEWSSQHAASHAGMPHTATTIPHEPPAHAPALASSPRDPTWSAQHAASHAGMPRDATTIPREPLPDGPRAIVLGVRAFAGRVPLRSRAGNILTRRAFRLATGGDVSDTQTGLRGFPAATLPWLLTLPGDRFEYEFRMLLAARSAGLELVEVPIETVYLEGNASSHFRPLADSARIWAPLLRFAASALLAFAIDTVALLVLHALTGWLLFSVVGARVLSASLNYLVNRRHVFPTGRALPARTTAARYFSLAGLLTAAGYGVLSALTDAGVSLVLAKIVTETALFAVSFSVQRAVVFAPERP